MIRICPNNFHWQVHIDLKATYAAGCLLLPSMNKMNFAITSAGPDFNFIELWPMVSAMLSLLLRPLPSIVKLILVPSHILVFSIFIPTILRVQVQILESELLKWSLLEGALELLLLYAPDVPRRSYP